MTAFAWFAAFSDFDWFRLDERHMVVLGFIAVVVATVATRLTRVLHGMAATLIAVALHLAIYFLPLAILLEMPFTSYAVVEFAQIVGKLLPAYAVAATAGILLNRIVHKNRRDPA